MAQPQMVLGDDPHCGIRKSVLHAGKGDTPLYNEGAKVLFRYITRKCDEKKTVLDDNRKDDKPLELIMGKKFKLEVWETCLKSMKRNEVASFIVHPTLVANYPLVAKSLRDIRAGKTNSGHSCCGGQFSEGLGYEDLNELLKCPQQLEFILEMVQVEEAGEYKKDVWVMSDQEKLEEVPQLKEQGNTLFKEKKHKEAADVYAKAIGILEQLLLREKPGDEPYLELIEKKMPLLSNFSQCKLFEGEYYQVIEHTTEVLKHQPENVKALFRRAKAHVGAWNPDDARTDFKQVLKLDPSLEKTVNKELKEIDKLQSQRETEDRKLLQGKLFS